MFTHAIEHKRRITDVQCGLVIHGDYVPDLTVMTEEAVPYSSWLAHTYHFSKDMHTCVVGLPTLGKVIIHYLGHNGWERVHEISAPEHSTPYFGKAVAVSDQGNILIVSDEKRDVKGVESGIVCCYVRDKGGWNFKGLLTPEAGRKSFGSVVSVKNGYFYVYDTTGGVFIDPIKIKMGSEKSLVQLDEVL